MNEKEEEKDRIGFWTQRWEAGQTGWHVKQIHTILTQFYDELIKSRQSAAPEQVRIFVPLCGKTLDLKWLYEQGHTVVGVEAVEKPIKDFFSEHSIKYKTTPLSSIPGNLHQTSDARLNIYECDLFNVNETVLGGKFDAVWDRGSLIAIYEEDRTRYGRLMKSLLKPDFRYLVEAVEYKSTTFSGPPRVVTRKTIDQLYADFCKIELLATSEGTHRLAGDITTFVYMFSPLSSS